MVCSLDFFLKKMSLCLPVCMSVYSIIFTYFIQKCNIRIRKSIQLCPSSQSWLDFWGQWHLIENLSFSLQGALRTTWEPLEDHLRTTGGHALESPWTLPCYYLGQDLLPRFRLSSKATGGPLCVSGFFYWKGTYSAWFWLITFHIGPNDLVVYKPLHEWSVSVLKHVLDWCAHRKMDLKRSLHLHWIKRDYKANSSDSAKREMFPLKEKRYIL